MDRDEEMAPVYQKWGPFLRAGPFGRCDRRSNRSLRGSVKRAIAVNFRAAFPFHTRTQKNLRRLRLSPSALGGGRIREGSFSRAAANLSQSALSVLSGYLSEARLKRSSISLPSKFAIKSFRYFLRPGPFANELGPWKGLI